MSLDTIEPGGAMTRRQLLRRLALLGLAGPIAAACQPTTPAPPPTAAPQPKAPAPAAPPAATTPPAAAPAATKPPAAAPAATKPPAAQAAQPAAQPTKPAVQPRRGGVFAFAVAGNPSGGFDPPATTDAISNNVTRHVCDYLVELDEKNRLQPSLAKSWSFPDTKTLLLSLREGVKFHDGSAWDAEAAKLNLDRLIETKVIRGDVVAPYAASADIVDPMTVRLNLKVPFAGIIRHFAHRGLAMISPTSLKGEEATRKQRPVGSGPFLFREFRQNDSIVLEANPNYWGGRPYLDRVVFRIVPEPSARVLMLKAGEVHAISTVAPAHAVQLQQEKDIEVITLPSDRTVMFGFNSLKKPFDDKRVRQALAHAMNLKAIHENLLLKFSPIGDSPISPEAFGYKSIRTYEYNPAKARELLAQAGYAQGFKTVLTAPKGRYQADFEIAQALQADFKAVGVNMEIQVIEGGTFITYLSTGPEKAEYELFMIGNAAVTGDAQQYLVTFFNSENWPRSNRYFYANKEFDALLDKAASTVDENQRLELYGRAQELIMEDLPMVPLYYEGIIAARRRQAQGFRAFSNLQYDMRQAWLEGA